MKPKGTGRGSWWDDTNKCNCSIQQLFFFFPKCLHGNGSLNSNMCVKRGSEHIHMPDRGAMVIFSTLHVNKRSLMLWKVWMSKCSMSFRHNWQKWYGVAKVSKEFDRSPLFTHGLYWKNNAPFYKPRSYVLHYYNSAGVVCDYKVFIKCYFEIIFQYTHKSIKGIFIHLSRIHF